MAAADLRVEVSGVFRMFARFYKSEILTKKLIIVSGPTAVGKTEWCIDLAQKLSSPIISCDSRQIYKEMTIGTAVPDPSQLAAVRHYFIQTETIHQLYTAGMYEQQAISLIEKLFCEGRNTLVMAGGSGFYAEAVCSGLDEMPPADPQLRKELTERIKSEGVESMRMDLKRLDPEAYSTIDIANPQRVLRAVEVCLLSGRKFSSYKLKTPKKRDFEIEKICLIRPREVLYDRINRRVLNMMDAGLLKEVEELLPNRALPALQTVGYKELFDWLDYYTGDRRPGLPQSLDEAIMRIQTNTRHYAKKQITWWKRDSSVRWISI